LAGDTLIYLPDTSQYVPIRDLVGQTNFRVKSLNPDSCQIETSTVSRAFCTGIKPVYKLTTEFGRTIRATANHQFYTLDGWKRLDQITFNDGIALPRTAAHLDIETVFWDNIVSIEPDGECDVYDLTVPGPSNFVANDIIAHNSIEQDADIVLFLYRDEVYNEDTERPNQADVIVAKHRNGPTGTIALYFRKELTQFANLQKTDLDLAVF
jgi:replicative DNA helicase